MSVRVTAPRNLVLTIPCPRSFLSRPTPKNSPSRVRPKRELPTKSTLSTPVRRSRRLFRPTTTCILLLLAIQLLPSPRRLRHLDFICQRHTRSQATHFCHRRLMGLSLHTNQLCHRSQASLVLANRRFPALIRPRRPLMLHPSTSSATAPDTRTALSVAFLVQKRHVHRRLLPLVMAHSNTIVGWA